MQSDRHGYSAHAVGDGIARIVRGDRDHVGMAAVVDNQHVLTCAHVINQARKEDDYAKRTPGKGETFDIRFCSPNVRRYEKPASGYVVKWGLEDSVGGIDLAVLKLTKPIPRGISPTTFSTISPEGLPWKVFGLHPNANERRPFWTTEEGTKVSSWLDPTHIQLDGTGVAGRSIDHGDSGTPVWCPKLGTAAIGIIATRHERYEPNRISCMISAGAILDFWPTTQLQTHPVPVSAIWHDSPRAVEIRRTYLADTKLDVTNLLKSVVEDACLLAVGVKVEPSATYLPRIYRSVETADEYGDVLSAFEASQGRMLLLGDPGSGKSTALLQIHEHLIEQAMKDASAPVPLRVNLSRFRAKAEKTGPLPGLMGVLWPRWNQVGADDSLENWLIQELTSYQVVTGRTAKSWMEQQRVAFLLDGLDEFDNEDLSEPLVKQRSELVALINELLKLHPLVPAVVCCRTAEYQPLQANKDTRLQLRGGVKLESLEPDEVAKYIKATNTTSLHDSIQREPALRDMASVPLTLRMITQAYGGSDPSTLPRDLPIREQRRRLLERYVQRMQQWKERRDDSKPIDLDPTNDVPETSYAYSPSQLKAVLGWLAVRMSIRMESGYPVNELYNFLSRGLDKERTNDEHIYLIATQGFFVLVGLVFAGAPFTIKGFTSLSTIIGAASACLLYYFVNAMLAPRQTPGAPTPPLLSALKTLDQSEFLAKKKKVRGAISVCILLCLTSISLFSILCFVVSVGSIPEAIASVSGSFFNSSQNILLVFGAVATLISALALAYYYEWGKFWLIVCASIVLLLAAFAIRIYLPTQTTVVYVILSALLAIPLVHFGVTISPPLALMAVLVVVLLLIINHYIITEPDWYERFVPAGILACNMVVDKAGPAAMGLLLGAGLGGFVAGVPGFTIGGALGVVISVLVGRLSLWNSCLQLTEGALLTPAHRFTLWLVGKLPLRSNRFYRYSADALLLKLQGPDVEFKHRLVRDYFALTALARGDADREQLLAGIAQMGYQGESAIDPLAEHFKSDDAEIRKAAISALGRIAAPAVLDFLSEAISGTQPPNVRVAAVKGIANLSRDDARPLLETLLSDTNDEVQIATIDIVGQVYKGNDTERLGFVKEMLSQSEANRKLLEGIATSVSQSKEVFYNVRKPEELSKMATCLTDSVVATLLEIALDREVVVTARVGAVRLLGLRPDLVSASDIASVLQDGRSFSLGPHVIRALGALRGPEAIESLLAIERNDIYLGRILGSVLKESLVSVISSLRDVDALRKVAGHRSTLVRKAVAKQLGKIEDDAALTILMELAEDRKAGVASAAIRILGEYSDPEANNFLCRLALEKKGKLQMAAIEAIGHSEANVSTLEELVKRWSWNAKPTLAAIDALAMISGHLATDALIEATRSRRKAVRLQATRVLGRRDSPDIAFRLIELLGDRSSTVRQQAAAGLRHQKSPSASEVLQQFRD